MLLVEKAEAQKSYVNCHRCSQGASGGQMRGLPFRSSG